MTCMSPYGVMALKASYESLSYIEETMNTPIWKNKRWVAIMWRAASENPNMTIKFVLEHIQEPWNWTYLTQNTGISKEDIDNNKTLPWDAPAYEKRFLKFQCKV